MSKDENELKTFRSKVAELSTLYRSSGGNIMWSTRLDEYLENSKNDLTSLANAILSNYGSMGALTDHSFYSDGKYDDAKNLHFCSLISQIADLGIPYIECSMRKRNVELRGRQAAERADHLRQVKSKK